MAAEVLTLPFGTPEPVSAVTAGLCTPARGIPAEPSDRPHGCGGCPARWGGQPPQPCGGCHLTFGGVSAFDAHRAGDACRPPAEVGLTLLTSRPYPCWGTPLDGGEVDR